MWNLYSRSCNVLDGLLEMSFLVFTVSSISKPAIFVNALYLFGWSICHPFLVAVASFITKGHIVSCGPYLLEDCTHSWL